MTKLRSFLAFALLLVACSPVQEDRPFDDDDQPPGSTPWNHDETVTCTTADECGEGEVCADGVCQMARCGEAFESQPPLGQNRYFGTDGELAVISDNTWVDAFEGSNGDYLNSWDLQSVGGLVVDVAGGNLTGLRPHSVAVAVEFSDVVKIKGDTVSELDVGLWPKAMAAGDVDGDGIDELVALADDGTISLCQVDLGTCSGASIPNVTGKDVVVADVDGDGFEEPMFLIDNQGSSQLIVWNTDAAETEQEESFGWSFNFPVVAIGAGKVTGAATAEVVMLEDGGWWGWSDDKLYVFQPASEEFILDQSVNGHTLDVAVGDRNSDDLDEIAILRSDKQIELFSYQNSQITSVMTTPVTVGDEAQRISFVDWNGDSASGRLVEGPELVAGDTVPVAALLFPPYPAEVSVGYKSASVFLGSTDSTDESMSDTISLSVGLGISFGAEAFGFKAKVGASISKSTSVTQTFSKSLSVGARYTANSEPELFGRAYAPIVMSCGCYHRYRYQTEDPANLIGGTGQTVDLYVPVGGQTQLWSSLRYNAMAEATGLYPKIEIPSQVGSVDTYPAAPIDLTAQPVVPEDMVFTDIPTFNASDVGYVNFFLSAGESETNAVAESTDFGVNSSFGGGVVSVDASINIGVSQGYSLRIGRSNLFGGGIPPIADDPDTPEDEFEVHRYSFQPYVYRQHYVDKYGEPAAFYVMNYTAAK